MKEMTYEVPATAEDAVAAVTGDDRARFLGGGSNLVDWWISAGCRWTTSKRPSQACASERMSATATSPPTPWCAGAGRASAEPCCPAPTGSDESRSGICIPCPATAPTSRRHWLTVN